ncbi:MAG: NTP transferase domain-containing protein [Caulobacteraceae bacterium]
MVPPQTRSAPRPVPGRDIAGLVLSGGRSSRFGGEKAAALLDGKPLLMWAVERLQPACAEVAVSARPGSDAETLAKGLQVLHDRGAILTAPWPGCVRAFAGRGDIGALALAVSPCDAPLLPGDLFTRLIAAAGQGAAVAETADGVQPLCALWPVIALPALETAIAGGAHPPVWRLLQDIGAAHVRFADAPAFANLNTREDLQRIAAARGMSAQLMLEKFEFLIALARERHFRRAAEQCGVTQPTLSAGIKALEETFGAALVNRGSRYIGLTPEGERVLEWARRLTGDARAMRQEVEALKRGVSGVIRLACIPHRPAGGRAPCAACCRPASGRELLGAVDLVQVDAGPAGRLPDRWRHHLSRQRAPAPDHRDALLRGGLSPGHRRRRPVRRARQRAVARAVGPAAVPVHPRHAEPAHRRPDPGRTYRRPDRPPPPPRPIPAW